MELSTIQDQLMQEHEKQLAAQRKEAEEKEAK